jgi:tetratricopeptide (TPR) repeat protein
VPPALRAPLAWLKFTIVSFRFSEVQDHLQTEGWDVRPLLVVRDVRAVFNSLLQKDHGRNGITSDDPPIRLRLSRFLEDWKLFRARGWPMICYERFVAQPDLLRDTCQNLGLSWDPAMMSWTKPVEQIADPNFGSPTFIGSRKASLEQTLNRSLADLNTEHVPLEDLQWMEQTFAHFNEVMGYPAHVHRSGLAVSGRAVPKFEHTRLHERISKNAARTQQALSAAKAHYQAGRPLQAESLCRQVLNNVPDSLDALRLLALLARDRGDAVLSRLVEELGAAVPNTADHFLAFGRVHMHLGQNEMAANAFRRASLLRPDLMSVRQELNTLFRRTGASPESRPVLHRDSA